MKTTRQKFEKFVPIEIPGTHCALQLTEVSITDYKGTTTNPAVCIMIGDDDSERVLAEYFEAKELKVLISYLQSMLHQIEHTS